MPVNLYKITNLKSGKVYIGKTSKEINKRFSSHCRIRKIPKMAINKAIRKYGPKAFRLEDLGFCLSDATANKAEKELIKYWKTKGKVYNLTAGGDGLSGYKFTKKQRQRLSKSIRGRPMTWSKKIHATLSKSKDEWRRKISEGMRRMSKEEKAARMRKIWRTRRLQS